LIHQLGNPDELPARALPDPLKSPTLTVPEAAAVLGISRAAAYAAVQRGDIPSIRIGHRLVVSTVALWRMLGLESK
jgi:excisionase family DNA binding protein